MQYLFASSPSNETDESFGGSETICSDVSNVSCGCLSSPILICPCSCCLFCFTPAGLESGHIPGAVNIPFHSFLSETGHEKSIEEIQEIFRAKNVDLSKPLTATCRKGVTACQIALAAFLCGKRDVAVYDGSWSEWFHRAPPHYKVSEVKRGKA